MNWNRVLTAVALTALVLCFAGAATGAERDDVVFRFAILSDRTGGHTPGVYPKVIEAINAQEPELVITVGDHIEGYGDDYERAHAEWDSVLVMLRAIEAPVHMTPGNHDIWDDESETIYTDRTGRRPFYSFDHENTHFVVLDNSRIESWAQMGVAQASWLLRDLTSTRAENVFVFFHKPLWDQTLRKGKEDELHTLLVEHNVDAAFCGHYHQYFAADYEGVEYTAVGSSGGAINQDLPQPKLRGEFFQYAMVSVKPDGYELTVHDLETGDVYPRDFVTVDLLDEIERIEHDLIELSPVTIVDGGDRSVSMTVAIENATDESIDGEAVWTIPEHWEVDPASAGYSIAPSERHELEYSAVRTGDIYPAPSVTLAYPLSDGRTLDVRKAARIVRTVRAPAVPGALALDGEVDDHIREGGVSVGELYPAYGYESVEGETEFIFAHDDENLLLTTVCHEAEPEEIVAAATDRDGAVYLDDCVGFFLQPDPEELVVYQIYVNPEGVVFDQMITFDENMWYTVHPEWNGEYEVAAGRKADRWVAELVIPYGSLRGTQSPESESPVFRRLGEPEDTDTSWGLNFRRKQQRTSGAVDWQVPIDYDPSTFGRIVLE